MLVISDNSALSALAEMGMAWILPKVVGHVTVPASVAREGRHPGAPPDLRALMARPPDWLRIVPDPPAMLPETRLLGPGEAAAITLAWINRPECSLVLDERRGRIVAKALGLPVTGLLAILVEAAISGELELEDALARLLATGFRLSGSLLAEARIRVAASKQSGS